MTVLRAATHASCSQCSPPTWHVVETANFKILSFAREGVSQQTAERCELLRQQLVARWLHSPGGKPWSPKCYLVLHADDASYARDVGAGGRGTLASALVDRSAGKVTLRRIDVRASRADWLDGALGHELTHVVLADRFADAPLPRWVDEGVAILADSSHKQRQHHHDFLDALQSRGQFRLLELLTLSDYPPAARWDEFYGQSAALVYFLVARAGERQFFEFVDASLEFGYDRAARECYGLGITELEQHWHAHAMNLQAPTASRQLADSRTPVRPASAVGN